MKRLLALIFGLLLVILSLSGNDGGSSYLDSQTPLVINEVEHEPGDYEKPSSVYGYYESLTANEKKLYEKLLSDMGDYAPSISFKNKSNCDWEKIYFAIVYDHPELFWIGSGGSIETSSSFLIQKTTFIPSYLPLEESQRAQMSLQLEEKAAEIASLIPPESSDYEKILFYHDYIIKNTHYEAWEMASCAYGCLVQGKATCMGYSSAFQLLLQNEGILCYLVTGTALDGGHAWNCILLEGDYYYTDVTWDEPGDARNNSDHPNDVNYDYFMISSEELLVNHTLDEIFVLPTVSGGKYDYFKYHGYYLEEYSFSEVSRLIKEQIKNEVVYIKFSEYEELEKAVDELYEQRRIWKVPALKKSGHLHVRYYHSPSLPILTIDFT